MFLVTEADADAIRTIFNEEGELSAAIELGVSQATVSRDIDRIHKLWEENVDPAEARRELRRLAQYPQALIDKYFPIAINTDQGKGANYKAVDAVIKAVDAKAKLYGIGRESKDAKKSQEGTGKSVSLNDLVEAFRQRKQGVANGSGANN